MSVLFGGREYARLFMARSCASSLFLFPIRSRGAVALLGPCGGRVYTDAYMVDSRSFNPGLDLSNHGSGMVYRLLSWPFSYYRDFLYHMVCGEVYRSCSILKKNQLTNKYLGEKLCVF